MTTQPTTEKKLTIQIRVEPGCLGPDGKAHIETFCAAAAKIFAAVEPELVSWTLLPRYDKQLPEQEFFIDYRKLTEEQASLFLRRLGRELGKCRRPSTPCWPNWWSATSRPSDGSLPAQKVLQREPFYFRQGKRLNFALFIDPPRRSGVCKRRCLCKMCALSRYQDESGCLTTRNRASRPHGWDQLLACCLFHVTYWNPT